MHFSPPFMCCCSTSSRKACNPYLLSLLQQVCSSRILLHSSWSIEMGALPQRWLKHWNNFAANRNTSQKRRIKLHGLAWCQSPWVGVYCNLGFLFEAWLKWSKKLVLFFLSSWVGLWQWESKESQPSCSMCRWWQEMQHLYPNTMHLLMSFCKCPAHPPPLPITKNFFSWKLSFSLSATTSYPSPDPLKIICNISSAKSASSPFLWWWGPKTRCRLGFRHLTELRTP